MPELGGVYSPIKKVKMGIGERYLIRISSEEDLHATFQKKEYVGIAYINQMLTILTRTANKFSTLYPISRKVESYRELKDELFAMSIERWETLWKED